MRRSAVVALIMMLAAPRQATATEVGCAKWVTDLRTGAISCSLWVSGAGGPGDPSTGDTSGQPEPEPPPVTCTYRSADEMGQGNSNLGLYGDLFVREREDGSIELAYYQECSDGTHGWIWVGDPLGGAPLPTPAMLADSAGERVERALPPPDWHTPAETDPRGFAFVNTPTYFWVGEGTWQPVVARAEFGPVWAEATGEPTALIVDPGDRSPAVRCEFEPPSYVPGTPTETFAGCAYRYLNSSALAPNGTAFPVTVSIEWHVTWRGSDGSGGDLGTLTTSAEPRDLLVAEVQAIVTGGSDS
jgi:hypothetical protein